MASAEQLLNEAQYAFQSITAGESRENRRNAARAKSLCRKIFRKYPGTTEAVVAHGIMMRLGEEAQMPRVHAGLAEATAATVTEMTIDGGSESEPFDFGGLIAVIFGTSKTVLGILAFVGLILFGFLGPFLFLPLIALAFLSSPLRRSMKTDQQRQVNEFVLRANEWIRNRRRSGRGLV